MAQANYITYRFRVKDSSCGNALGRMAGAVNFTWNFCNDATKDAHAFSGRFLSAYELQKLAIGASAELGILRDTIDATMAEYATRRAKVKRLRLNWRTRKRSLGWIPFKSGSVAVVRDTIRYGKHVFRIWKSREAIGAIKSGSFSQDARGRWYVSLVCSTAVQDPVSLGLPVGIDLGLKTTATLSDGATFTMRAFRDSEPELAKSQRARKKKRTAAIHAKIANRRKDFLHKTTTRIVREYSGIYVGNVSPSKMKKTRMAKGASDSGWYMLKSMLAYKAIRLGKDYREVNEKFSTVTCSTCLQRTGPSGLSGLGVREWTCGCGARHDRDVNSARNILRVALDTPIKGAAHGGEVK